jgi:hypothetical protein
MYFSISFCAEAASFLSRLDAWVAQKATPIESKDTKQIWINVGLFIPSLLFLVLIVP